MKLIRSAVSLLICAGASGLPISSAAAQRTRVGEEVLPVQSPLDGIHDGQVTTFTHPRGWFTFELPQGWSVATQAEESLVLNPGLTQADTLDALVLVSFGQLDQAQKASNIEALFESVKSSILQDLASQGIEVSNPLAVPRAVALAHAAGLVQEWKGKAGGRDVGVWLGGLVKDSYYLAVTAVMVVGKENRYLPGVKRVLHSVNPRPPERNRAAEQALAGARFSAIETRPGGSRGSFSSILEFSAGNRVKKTMILSGMVGFSDVGGGSEEWGAYEVIGDEVHLAFSSDSDVLSLTTEQGEIVALRRDGRVYRRR